MLPITATMPGEPAASNLEMFSEQPTSTSGVFKSLMLWLCGFLTFCDITKIVLCEYRPSEYCRFRPSDLSEHLFDFANKHNTTQNLKLVVVVASHAWPPSEPLEWLNEQPWPVFVSTKEPGKGLHSEPWGNVGFEVASFLRFIVDFWEALPENVAMIHGHEYAWHQSGYSMGYILRNLCLNQPYFSLNASPQRFHSWKTTVDPRSELVDYLRQLLGDITKTPSYFMDRCCSQFVVNRARIYEQPLGSYKKLLALMTDKDRLERNVPRTGQWAKRRPGTPVDSLFFEEVWHHLFGSPRLVQHKLYGKTIATSVESGLKLISYADHCLEKVLGCPSAQCKNSPICRAALERERRTFLANVTLYGKPREAPQLLPGYWNRVRKQRLKRRRTIGKDSVPEP